MNELKKWYIKFYVYAGKRGFPSVRANLPIEIFRTLLGTELARYSGKYKIIGMAFIDNQWRLVIQLLRNNFNQDTIEKELEELTKIQTGSYNQFKI